MKMIKIQPLTCAIVAFSAMLFGNAAFADQHEGPTFAPVEIYTCNFLKGKGMDDLDKVSAKWNAWMDDNDNNNYTAVTFTPQFNDPELAFDVAWLGAWPDGKAMGEGMHGMLNEGKEVIAEFYQVLECGVHAGFAAATIKAPQGPPGDTGVVVFSNCSMAEGKKPADSESALRAWGEYLKGNGIEGPIWAMWPAYGGGNADYDFKLVAAHKDYPAFGAAFDQMTRGGGYLKMAEILGGVVDCDTARVYDTRLRRSMEPPK